MRCGLCQISEIKVRMTLNCLIYNWERNNYNKPSLNETVYWIIYFYSLEDKFTQTRLERPYNSIHSFGSSYGEHKRYLEFSDEDYKNLIAFAKEIGIPLTASSMDPVSFDILVDDLNVPFVKIGSGDANNPLLLEKVAKRTNINAVISTGMSDIEDVQRIYDLFSRYRSQKNFVILQCTSSYPTLLESVNLNVISRYCLSYLTNCCIKLLQLFSL